MNLALRMSRGFVREHGAISSVNMLRIARCHGAETQLLSRIRVIVADNLLAVFGSRRSSHHVN